MTPGEPAPAGRYDTSPASDASSPAPRVILMIVIALIVLGAIGWLIWRASSERKTPPSPTVVEQPTATSTTPMEPGTVMPATTPAPAAAASIRVTPAMQDYGIIRKGTRAVRQFELINTGTIPLSIEVARSACRCLYYDYNNKKIAPNAHETITVTVDAAKAKGSAIDEQLAVTSKDDPNATATIGVRATIK
jgi:heme/copper-type cytochrome/quinol oxidase subunit 2